MLTPDDLDMLWRVELAESFTSPTTPSRLTLAENMAITMNLAKLELVTDASPRRLTMAGFLALEDLLPNRLRVRRPLVKIAPPLREAPLRRALESVLRKLEGKHGKLPATDNMLALIGAELLRQPELEGTAELSVTKGEGATVRVRTTGLDITR